MQKFDTELLPEGSKLKYGALAGVFLTTLYLLMEQAYICDQDPTDSYCEISNVQYAIAFCVIAWILVIVEVLFIRSILPSPEDARLMLVLPGILVLWCAIAVIVQTFSDEGIYFIISATTGFFSLWLSLIFSCFYLLLKAREELATESQERSTAFAFQGVIFVASLVVMSLGAQDCDTGGCSDREGFAVAAGLISALFVAGMMFYATTPSSSPVVLSYCSVFLIIWWLCSVIATTTALPFFNGLLFKGNAFFGNWIAFLGSFVLLYLYSSQVEESAFGVTDIYLMLICVSSIIVICQAAQGTHSLCELVSLEALGFEALEARKCEDLENTGIAFGVISAVLSAGCVIMMNFLNGIDPLAYRVAGIFLCVFWFIGSIVLALTLNGPFYFVNSGTVATWICLFVSIAFTATLYEFSGNLSGSVLTAHIVAIAAGSYIVLANASQICEEADACEGPTVFAIIAPLLTYMLLAAVYFLPDYAFFPKIILALFWLISVAVMTIFEGPFNAGAISGFYGAWLVTFASLSLLVVPVSTSEQGGEITPYDA